jgi:hypothetical protein
MKNWKFLILQLILLISCSKETFQANKSTQTSTITTVSSTSTELCSSSTLVKPKVDILMLWDNSSSFNFVTDATKSSMSNLISSVSEKFDYHVLNAPLVPASTSDLYEMSLIASDTTTVSGTATNILKSKDTAISSLTFTQGVGSAEMGVDRAYSVITANRSNGIFRDGAYTIIVLMSNEDDKGCELTTGYNSCTTTDKNNYLSPRKQKLLCLRGATSAYDCSGYATLNSTMMRFINISPLTACTNGLNKVNYNYKTLSKFIYESSYNNGWPTSSDHLSPDVSGYYDSYNLCTVDFSHIFDGVNTAIKQTVIKHVYSYWPVASSTTSVDPDTLVVTRDDGKILTNNTGVTSPTDGYSYLGAQTNHSTRSYPTEGEYYTGKMIQLFGTNGDDLIVYPRCLTISYKAMTSNYGYIYLESGEPNTSTLEVTINGTIVPQSASNGWTYIGLQYVASLDSSLKVANLPATATSGYFVKLNGTYKVSNSGTVTIKVYYTSKSSN